MFSQQRMEELEDIYDTPVVKALLTTKECAKMLEKISNQDGSIVCSPLSSCFEDPARITVGFIGICKPLIIH